MAIKNGHEPSFRKVFDTYYKIMIITAYQVLKNEELSRDAAQEVFLKIWQNRNHLHKNIKLLPYLKRATSNSAINILKSRRHHISSGEAPLSVLEDSTQNPQEIYENIEIRKAINKAIDSLPDKCRAVYMLSRNDGLSHNEIAEQLNISTKTIENHITKALKVLRRELGIYKTLVSIMMIITTSI